LVAQAALWASVPSLQELQAGKSGESHDPANHPVGNGGRDLGLWGNRLQVSAKVKLGEHLKVTGTRMMIVGPLSRGSPTGHDGEIAA
jgi:hypothetical protein